MFKISKIYDYALMVVKFETSNLKTIEFDHISWFELAQIQESMKIQEPTNIRLD
jgi:hypothetical protein